MKSSTLKRVALCILLLLVGAVGGYLLANHQHHKKVERSLLPHRYTANSIFEDTIKEMEEREKEMNNLFNDMGNYIFEDSQNKLDNTEIVSGNTTQAKGSFQFYQKKSKNGEDTSYEINGNWNEDGGTGTIIMTGINTDGKEFSFSGKMQNGKSEGIMQDKEGHSKTVSFENININNILENSNNITE